LNRSAFRFPQPACNLPFDGERYVSGVLGDASSGDIQSEHYHRYLFAIQFCAGKDVLDIAVRVMAAFVLARPPKAL
jgi:O-antigen biosynthesis protein